MLSLSVQVNQLLRTVSSFGAGDDHTHSSATRPALGLKRPDPAPGDRDRVSYWGRDDYRWRKQARLTSTTLELAWVAGGGSDVPMRATNATRWSPAQDGT